MTDFPQTPGVSRPPKLVRPPQLAPLPPRPADRVPTPPAPVAAPAPVAPSEPEQEIPFSWPAGPEAEELQEETSPTLGLPSTADPDEPEQPEETLSEKQKREIKAAKRSNMFLFGSNREVRRLGLYLNEGEEVLLIASGSRKDERGRGLIVATDRRVLFIWDGWVFRTEQDFQYETISSVEFNTSILFGVFTVYGLGDEVSYNWVDRFIGRKMTRLIRQKVMESRHNQG